MAKKHLIVRFWVTVVAVLAVLAETVLWRRLRFLGKTLVIVVGTAPGRSPHKGSRSFLPGNTSPEIQQWSLSTRLAVAVGTSSQSCLPGREAGRADHRGLEWQHSRAQHPRGDRCHGVSIWISLSRCIGKHFA